METGEIEIYQSTSGTEVQVVLKKKTLWLTQRQMAELYGKDTDTIGLHLKNIYQDAELNEAATTEEYSVVQTEGKRKVRRSLKHYNLDAIISVCYRVNSNRGTQFRIWATQRLKDYFVQSTLGFALFVAASKPEEMQVVKRLIISVLNRNQRLER